MPDNPKVAVAAFTSAALPRKIAGTTIVLQPFCMAHAYALEAIGNPLQKGANLLARDLLQMAALLCVGGREARALSADKAALEAAATELSLDLRPAVLAPLAEAIIAHIQEAFATYLPPAAPKDADVAGETRHQPRTRDSAGASPSSPTSARNSTSPATKPSTRSRSPRPLPSPPQPTPPTAVNLPRRTTSSASTRKRCSPPSKPATAGDDLRPHP
ncbi:MAG: hypothetical protein LBG65_07590 [Puniceicoccales bacterium]|jgi:hypothetical protein|nr:hypothetical protein [Puniceicoccales bacterium]